MPRGSKKGEHRGGRKKGQPNKKTLEAALQAEREVAQAKADNRPLGKEVLDHLMGSFLKIAQFYGPKKQEGSDEFRLPSAEFLKEYERWATLAGEMAHKLAPYQSPTFRAIMIAPPGEEQGADQKLITTRFTLSIFDRSPNAKLIEHEPAE